MCDSESREPDILVLYQHYHTPDCPGGARIYSLLETLQSHAQVTLVTSTARRSERRSTNYSWFPLGIRAHEIDVPYRNEMSVAQRIWSYLLFAVRTLWYCIRHTQPDLVYGISTPLSTAGIAAFVARWHNVPWVFEIRDLWPAFPIQMGAIPFRWLQRALYSFERALYQSAEHIITVSPDMTNYVEKRGISSDRVTTVLPGSDPDYLYSARAPSPEELRREYGLPTSPAVLYAGTFGRANAIPSLIETAQRCRDDDFSFLFVGRGFFEPELRTLAENESSVFLIPPQPQHHMGAWYALADISLVSFLDLPVLASNSPAKFFDSVMMGTPVIVTNPGWTKEFVETHECGWFVPPSRPELLANRLRTLLSNRDELDRAGRNARAAADKYFVRSEQYDRISSLVEELLS